MASILLIDTKRDWRTTCAAFTKHEQPQAEVDEASNPTEAFEKMTSHLYDLIIVGDDEAQIVPMARALSQGRVVVCSSDEDVIASGKAHGADDGLLVTQVVDRLPEVLRQL